MDGENYVQWKSDPADDGLNLEELERYLKQHKESRYELWGANRKRNPGRGERERQMHLNYGWWLRALRRLRDENERMRKCREVSDRAYRNLMEEAKSACTCRQKLEGAPDCDRWYRLVPMSEANCTPSAGSEPWGCEQPVIKDQDATLWLGQTVISRPDGGGWPLESGVVTEGGRGGLGNGWFLLVNARYPHGILTHTQEVYPPGFQGCDLPCCAHLKQNAEHETRRVAT